MVGMCEEIPLKIPLRRLRRVGDGSRRKRCECACRVAVRTDEEVSLRSAKRSVLSLLGEAGLSRYKIGPK